MFPGWAVTSMGANFFSYKSPAKVNSEFEAANLFEYSQIK